MALEEILRELVGDEVNEHGLPPGFRFHPTDEELITFYLASKVFNGTFCGVQIAEVDLNRCEPWELPGIHMLGARCLAPTFSQVLQNQLEKLIFHVPFLSVIHIFFAIMPMFSNII